MLKICGRTSRKEVIFTSDPYIPIDLKLGIWSEPIENTVYWRTGDFKKNLLEVGIGSGKKELRSITLVAWERKIVEITRQPVPSGGKREEGCPIFEFGYAETMVDEKSQLRIFLGDQAISILFSDPPIHSIMKNERVDFFMNPQKEWIGICIHIDGGIDKKNFLCT